MNTEHAAKLAELRAPHPYMFPGSQIPIAVRLLGERDVDHARIEAQRYCAKLKVDLVNDPDMLERAVTRGIIWRSFMNPEPGADGKHAQLWASDSEILELTTVSVEACFSLYLEHQERFSPLRRLTDEELVSVAKTCAAGARGREQVSTLDHQSLVRLVIALARRVPAETVETAETAP